MIRLSKNFTANEFYCPCLDCKRKGQHLLIDQDVVDMLQEMRDEIGNPLYVTIGGGVRCRKYNKSVSNYPKSLHVWGQAADVTTTLTESTIENMTWLALLADDIGFPRIGLYPYSYSKFIHVDLAQPKPSKSWIRDANGIYHYYRDLEDAIEEVRKLCRHFY